MLKNGAAESGMLTLENKSCMLKLLRRDKKRHVEVKSSMLKKTACASTEVFADDFIDQKHNLKQIVSTLWCGPWYKQEKIKRNIKHKNVENITTT